jgi:hypothetical protein
MSGAKWNRGIPCAMTICSVRVLVDADTLCVLLLHYLSTNHFNRILGRNFYKKRVKNNNNNDMLKLLTLVAQWARLFVLVSNTTDCSLITLLVVVALLVMCATTDDDLLFLGLDRLGANGAALGSIAGAHNGLLLQCAE